MPSIIDRRIAARLEQKQIESLLLLEGVGDNIDLMANRTERAALAAILSDDAQGAADELRRLLPRVKAELERQFVRMAHWSYREATSILASEIPRRWMRLANPIVLFAGEDSRIEISPGLLAETPTEPVANAGKRMGDKEWLEFCRQFVFPPPSAETVEKIIHRTVAGQVWTERLDALSHQIDSFERLAQTLTTAYSQGASREEIVSQVKPHVRMIASSARRIARTEGLRIANAVQRDQYSSLGDMLAGVQIIATLDENTRPHHAARNGTVYWYDRRRRPSIDQLPVLPDEPNCRCFDSPVLKEPEEFKNDPALRAEFQNAAGAMIPDPSVYTQWFERADRGRRMMAVGVKRYQSMERQLAGQREPQWTDFIDPEGRLLGITSLRAETPQQRAARLRQVQDAIRQRGELLSKINSFGFLPRNGQNPPGPKPVPKPEPPPRPSPPPITPPNRSEFYRGNTKPVSSALILSGNKDEKAAAKRTLAAIAKVHGDGELPEIPVRWGKSRLNLGAYHYRMSGPVKIQISKHGGSPELTLAHEIGHFLDHQGIGQGRFGTQSDKLEKLYEVWRNAVRNSVSSTKLHDLLNGPDQITVANAKVRVDKQHLRYLLDPRELFARSYAQWIAQRSQDEVLLKQVKMRMPSAMHLYADHWESDDFQPIGAALDAMFQELGWLNDNSPPTT